MSPYCAGIDGGATRARAVIVDGHGREMARAEMAGAVASELDATPAAGAIARVVEAAAAEAGVALPLLALWAGMAGAGREAARSAVEGVLKDLGLAASVHVGTDAEAAFSAAFGSAPGILLIAGTGSMALARASDGTEVRVGGWGALLGDEGSGFWIAMQALGCVARAEDGRGRRTELRDRVLTRLGLPTARALIPWAEQAGKAGIASLAPDVLAVAQDGDAVAGAIRADALVALRDHVVAVVDRLGDQGARLPVALWGGLVQPGGPLRGPLLALMEPLGLPVLEGSLDPALGAARLALRMTAGGAA